MTSIQFLSKLVAVCAILSFFPASFAIKIDEVPSVIGPEPGTHKQANLLLIGSFEGTFFFYGNTSQTRNWYFASSECRAAGLSLATFCSYNEFEFIRSRLLELNVHVAWTGGILKGGESSLSDRTIFKWNDENNSPIEDEIQIVYSSAEATTLGLAYNSDSYLWVQNGISFDSDYICQT